MKNKYKNCPLGLNPSPDHFLKDFENAKLEPVPPALDKRQAFLFYQFDYDSLAQVAANVARLWKHARQENIRLRHRLEQIETENEHLKAQLKKN